MSVGPPACSGQLTATILLPTHKKAAGESQTAGFLIITQGKPGSRLYLHLVKLQVKAIVSRDFLPQLFH
jgi:hypothetical protein